MRTKKKISGWLANAHKPKELLACLVWVLITLPIYSQVLTLQPCFDTAQGHNMNLRIGRNNIAIGEQKQKESKANLIPKVNVVGDYKYFIDLPYQLMPMSTFDPTAPEAQFGVPHNISASIQVALYNNYIYPFVALFSIPVAGIGVFLSKPIVKRFDPVCPIRIDHVDGVGHPQCHSDSGFHEPAKSTRGSFKKGISACRERAYETHSNDYTGHGIWNVAHCTGQRNCRRMEKWLGLSYHWRAIIIVNIDSVFNPHGVLCGGYH